MRGGPPKPPELHVLHGTRSRAKREEGHQSPTPAIVSELPSAPPTLITDEAVRMWTRYGQLLIECGVLRQTDLAALEGYCLSYSNMVEAQNDINDNGMSISGATGGTVKNPACTVWKEAMTEFRTFGTMLGLDPASRSRININNGKKKETTKDIGDLRRPSKRS